jgi:chromosome transmission fidelity protein 8
LIDNASPSSKLQIAVVVQEGGQDTENKIMPTIPIHPPSPKRSPPSFQPSVPHTFHTPAGLAILELQGTINFPPPSPDSAVSNTHIGRLKFPLYTPSMAENERTWMKKVYFYVGEHQRLTGEVRKLEKPLGVLRRRRNAEGGEDELEIMEVIRWKIVFRERPEPVGADGE